MEEKTKSSAVKVLICDDSVEKGVKFASELIRFGIYAYTRPRNSEIILRSILNDKPDVVVCDIDIDETDAISILQKSKSILSKSPAFIIFSEMTNQFIKRQILQNGASCFLSAPFTTEDLYKAIRSITGSSYSVADDFDVELVVTEIIQKIGIPAHIKGYRYIRTAIIKCLENRDYVNGITKNLYPEVASIHDTTPIRVERAIRNAIDVTWQRGNKEVIYSYFGYRADYFIRPTNSEFISLLVDKIYLMMKSRNNSKKSF